MPRPKLLALLLLALLPCLLFPGAIPGPRVVAADDHMSVHHVFRSAQGPGGRVRNSQLSDPALQFRALRDRVRSSWSQGRVPLWNPDIFGGAPLLADAQSAACNPLVLLELLLPPAMAQDLRSWLVLFGAGLGAALLAWSLGATAPGGLVAGAAAMLSAFPVCRLLHPHAMVYAWIPWLAWSWLRLGRGGGGLPLALCTAGLLTAGHPQTALHGFLFALCAAACVLRGWRPWALAAAGLICGLLLAAPAWLPFLEQLQRSSTAAVHGGNRLAASSLLGLVLPDPSGHPARGDWQGMGGHLENNLHVGALAVGLALYGLRRRAGQLWVAGAILALAVALGLPLLSWIPANHARLGGMAGLALALAAGLALPRRRWAWVLAVLVPLELLVARRSDQSMLPQAEFRPRAAAWSEALRDRTGEGRIAGLGWAIQPDTAALAGMRDLRGYDLPVSRDTEALMAALDPRLQRPWFPISALNPRSAGLLRFAAVRYLGVVAGDGQAEASVEELVELQELDAPLRLFELDAQAPRAWLAFSASQVPSQEAALSALEDVDAARARPPLERGPETSSELVRTLLRAAPAAIRIVALDEPWPEELRCSLQLDRPALLVVADAWAPGWRAESSGRRIPVLRLAGAFRGLALDPGRHELRLRYQPLGWIWGRRLGLLGLLGALGLALMLRRQPSGPNPEVDSGI